MSTALARTLAAALVVALSACGSRVTEHSRPYAPRAETTPVTTQAADEVGSARAVPRAPVTSLAPVRGSGEDEDPRWALVVGIDDYPGDRNDLSTAVDDARTMLAALRALGFPDGHVRTLIGDRATSDAVLAGARWLAERTGPGQTGVFLYAGHARQVSGADSDAEELDEALVTADFENVPDGALADALRPARGALWLVFATCNAAGFADAAAPGRVLSFASGEDELAYESAKLGASYFVEFAVRRAILRDGVSTAEEAVRRGWKEMSGRFEEFRPEQIDLHPGPLPLTRRPAQAGV